MNTKLSLVSLLALSLGGLAILPTPARAGDKERAAIAGFIGGIIVGANVRHTPDYCPPPAPRYSERYSNDRHDYRHAPRNEGYWDTVTVKTWVPGRWTVRYDSCGHRDRIFEHAHYEYRTERVWIQDDCRH